MNLGVKPSPELATRLRQALSSERPSVLAARFGVGRSTVLAVAAGVGVTRASLAAVQGGLEGSASAGGEAA